MIGAGIFIAPINGALLFQPLPLAEDLGGYVYQPNYREEQQKKQIKKTKSEIEKLDSVLSEYQRRQLLAEESLSIAQEKERLRLLKAQNELIEEINRLLMVKAELMARKKREEQALVILMIASRRKLRAFNLTMRRN
jgi:hypothetical protein